MRAAIYARYSSDHQSERSIDDQLTICREMCEREGWPIVEVYTDYALSGASTINRPAFNKMLEDARGGRWDALVAEDLDRLSRDQADTATLYKNLEFAGIRIMTVSGGLVDELQVGFKSTINAVFLKQMAFKIRRGQRGRVAARRIPGGILYGYRKTARIGPDGEPERGLREIDEAQANVVRRIFEEYAAGASARTIAGRLNAEGIPAPRGGTWQASTINGNRGRQNGILQNELYIGRIVYNRQRFVKDPSTGRRVGRANPRSEWITEEAPELRIIEQGLWERAQRVRRTYEAPAAPVRARRPTRPLSGLVACGVCGGSAPIVKTGRYGCIGHRERGTCDNNHTISAEDLEARVLAGLRDHALHPDLVREFVREYQARMQAAEKGRRSRSSSLERRAAELDRQGRRLAEEIASGAASRYTADLLREIETEREDIGRQLTETAPENVITFHPNLPELYRQKMDGIRFLLDREGPGRNEAINAIRSLVDRIEIYPGDRRGEVDAYALGHLEKMIRLAAGVPIGEAGSLIKVVAGEGFALDCTFPAERIPLPPLPARKRKKGRG